MRKIVEIVSKKKRPVRLLQFGQGNFLRAFCDYMIDVANESDVCDIGIIMLKNTLKGDCKVFREQDDLYTVCLRGKQCGEIVKENRIITSIQKTLSCYDDYTQYIRYAECETLSFVVSNTTEAGIVFEPEDLLTDAPPSSFPAKLTQFLYRRYCHFNGEKEKGLIVLATELIESNGEKLSDCVRNVALGWKLPETFIEWLEFSCVFASSLVDRIVTGFPKERDEYYSELGYEDKLIDVAEPFALWVVEDKDGTIARNLPLDRAGPPVVFTKDIAPYHERKVRILNGAHTASALAANLMGYETVYAMMGDGEIREYINRLLFSEVIPTLDMESEELVSFVNAVIERFENPFLNHSLRSISLYSISKWRMRLLPTLIAYQKKYGKLPRSVVFSFAALAAFYSPLKIKDDRYLGTQEGGESYILNDDNAALAFFFANQNSDTFIRSVAENETFWGEDLSRYPGFVDLAAEYYETIKTEGVRRAMLDSIDPKE